MTPVVNDNGRVTVTPNATPVPTGVPPTPPISELMPPAWTPPGFISKPVSPSEGGGIAGGPFSRPY